MYCFNNVNILLNNVYMPCDSTIEVNNLEYQDVLCELSRICEQFTSSVILLGGDFNTDIARSKSFNTNNFKEFLEKENLVNCINHVLSDIDFTYESKVNGERSVFDHFIVPENVFPLITKHSVLHDVHNFSDHSPIALSVYIDYKHVKTHMYKPCIIRDKATDHDILRYQTVLNILLADIKLPYEAIHCTDYFCTHHNESIQVFYDNIITACINAAADTSPVIGNSSLRRSIAEWEEHVSSSKDKALFWHKLWKQNGCPHQGIVADICSQYHYAVRQAKINSDILKSNSIAQHFAENDPSKFWQDINKFIGKKSISPNNIDGETDSNKIANNFACKYEKLYNMVSFNQVEMNELMQNVTSDNKHICIEGGCNSQHHISVTNIESAMKHIKSNKKDGFDDVSTSHLIHASSVLNIHMSLLFTAMLHHGFSPSPFRFSKLIHIVKNKRKSLHDSNNYCDIYSSQ